MDPSFRALLVHIVFVLRPEPIFHRHTLWTHLYYVLGPLIDPSSKACGPIFTMLPCL